MGSTLHFFWSLVVERLTTALVVPFRPNQGDVLDIVNRGRDALDMKRLEQLPGGAVGQPSTCPLAFCLPGIVGATGVCVESRQFATNLSLAWGTSSRRVDENRFVVHFPSLLRRFVRDFDLGGYPRLASNPHGAIADTAKSTAVPQESSYIAA